MSRNQEANVRSTQRRREEETKPSAGSTLFSVAYVAIVILTAFLLSSLIMDRVDLYDLLGLNRAEIPLINVPGRDIPAWSLQLVLGLLIFFMLQPLVFIAAALFGVGKKEEDLGTPGQSRWDR
jgi:hypothetical protein